MERGDNSDALRGVNVDRAAAWWLDTYLHGRMALDQLLDALHSLDDDLGSTPSDFRGRIAALQSALRDIQSRDVSERGHVEEAAIAFLGEHPARFLEHAGPADWYMKS